MYKWLFCLLVLLCLCGCAAKTPSPEESLTAVVTTLYNVPDDFHEKNYQNYLAADGPESEGMAIAARLNHNKERFHKGDFADGALDTTTQAFAEKDIYLEPYLLAQGASLSCDAVKIIPVVEPGCISFSAEVILADKDGSETAYTVDGWAGFDTYDKLTWVEITGDSGLGKRLGAAHWPSDNIIDTHGGPTPGPPVTPAP